MSVEMALLYGALTIEEVSKIQFSKHLCFLVLFFQVFIFLIISTSGHGGDPARENYNCQTTF